MLPSLLLGLVVIGLARTQTVQPAASSANPFTYAGYNTPSPPLPSSRAGGASLPANATSNDAALKDAYLFQDTGRYGPEIELIHLYYGYWPTGIAVSRDGQVFTCYPRGNETYTLGKFVNATAEEAWPNRAWNTPATLISRENSGYSVASNSSFLFVQSVVIDGRDRLWALDTGRPSVNGSYLLAEVPGGPKLVRFDISTKEAEEVITFPSNVVYADSSLNDVRFDLRSSSDFPSGVAYLTDSSPQRAGLIVVNLATHESWRYLDGHYSVQAESQFISTYNGKPFFSVPSDGSGLNYFQTFTADGIALSPDGTYLYYSPISSRNLFRIPTSFLKNKPGPPNNIYGNILAQRAVQNLGQKGGHADGLETNSAGYIYQGSPEHNAIWYYEEASGLTLPFVRDPRIQFPDTLSVVDLDAGGSYLYFTSNQLWLGATYNNNTDLRVKPYAAFRVKLPKGGKAYQTSD